ncbi:MAG: methionine aminopeptidase [Leucobacter sp.]
MTKRDWGIDDPEETYWFNTRTGEVEEGPQSLAQYRIGPFETRAEAERAPEVVAERARKWAEEDAAED